MSWRTLKICAAFILLLAAASDLAIVDFWSTAYSSAAAASQGATDDDCFCCCAHIIIQTHFELMPLHLVTIAEDHTLFGFVNIEVPSIYHPPKS